MHLCSRCTEKLEHDLREVESTVEAVWAAAARMNVGSGSVGTSGHSEAAEPTNARAYDAGRTLNVILTGWARALGHHEPHAVKAANALLAQIREVREQDWAPVLKQELRDALTDCNRATDRAAPRIFAGICPTELEGQECATPVYTPEGRTEARCKTCGSRWDVTDWRDRALLAAGPATGTPAEISRMLSDPVTREALPQGTIRQWVNRGKLTHVNEWERWMAGLLEQPIPPKRYQMRKVRNLWARAKAAAEERRARLAA